MTRKVGEMFSYSFLSTVMLDLHWHLIIIPTTFLRFFCISLCTALKLDKWSSICLHTCHHSLYRAQLLFFVSETVSTGWKKWLSSNKSWWLGGFIMYMQLWWAYEKSWSVMGWTVIKQAVPWPSLYEQVN